MIRSKNTPIIRKDLDEGVLGEANMDGSVYVDKSVKPGSPLEKRVLAHEGVHAKQMKEGTLAYTDNDVTYKGKSYPRKDGKIKYNGKFYPEGSNVFPWEQDAKRAEEDQPLSTFDLKPFKKMRPPSDNSFDTMQEIKELERIPLNRKFVKDNDDIEGAFKKLAEAKGITNYDSSIAKKLIEDSAPLILELKNFYNRKRPKVIAGKLNITMKDIEMDSMKTPSYPSGHSTQGFLIAKVLSDEYPSSTKAFNSLANNISYSRRVAHAHYKSDSKMGEKLGNAMYKHIKNKQS